jgi:hypothetical protein
MTTINGFRIERVAICSDRRGFGLRFANGRRVRLANRAVVFMTEREAKEYARQRLWTIEG